MPSEPTPSNTGHTGHTQISTPNAPPPLPVYSQAIVCNGMVYCSGQVAMDPETKKLVEGGVSERTHRCLQNLNAVLTAAGTSMDKVIRVGIFLTTMDNFAAMNRVYDTYFPHPKPARTCVAVKELPLGTDVEIECVAHL